MAYQPTAQELAQWYGQNPELVQATSGFIPRENSISRMTALGNPQASALATTAIGSNYAATDPLVQALSQRANQALGGLNPDQYSALARGAGARMDAFQGAAGQDRAQMQRAIGALGNMPSAVDAAAARQREEVGREIAARAASTRGGYSPAVARAALMASGDAQARIGADAVSARAQEERQARLAQLEGIGSLRTAESQAAGTADTLGRTQGAFLESGDAQRQNLINAYGSRESDIYGRFANQVQAEQNFTLGKESQPATWEKVANIAVEGTKAAAKVVPLLSDKRSKMNIESADTDLDRFLAELEPSAYRYKPGAGEGPGRRVGVMAQDLEESRIGKDLVSEEGGVKKVDYSPDTIGPIVLAALARLNERIDRMGA